MKKESDIFEKVLDFVRKNELIKRGESVLVSLSGGPDSTFLLHAMIRLKDQLGISKVGALHINHMLRGEESERDENFSVSISRALGVEIFVEKVDVKSLAAEKKLSIEEAARMAREKIYDSYSSWDRIALGHTLDDHIETVVMRIFKGSGVKGLIGISPVRGKIIRPILPLRKREIVEYLKNAGIDFIVDSSNLSRRFLRNRIRLDVIPILERTFGTLDPVLYVSEDAAIIWEFIKAEAEKVLKGSHTVSPTMFFIELEKARKIHKAVFAAILHSLVPDETSKGLGRSVRQRFTKILESGKGRAFIHDWIAEVSRDWLFFYKKMEEEKKLVPADPGYIKIGHALYKLTLIQSVEYGPWSFPFNPSSGKIYIREWREGDRVEYRNMSKKVKKLFQEARVPSPVKKVLPVFVRKGEIIWIPPVYKKKEERPQMTIRLSPPEALNILFGIT